MSPRMVAFALLFLACTQPVHQATVRSPHDVPARRGDTTGLKAHMVSGDVYLLHAWQVLDSGAALQGTGKRYDASRKLVDGGTFTLATDSITLLEATLTNHRMPAGIVLLGAVTLVYGAVSAACLADPKSCFGSCPTFYVWDGTREVLQAEGFSASFARVLEATDLDALPAARPRGSRVDVIMRNEAQETHVVRTVQLRAVERRPGAKVFATGDRRFFSAARLDVPLTCAAGATDCRGAVTAFDGTEYRSVTDPEDLAARETIELEFPPATGRQGLVLAARHSFVSTYVFYQTLGHMGRNAGTWLARFERLGPERMPEVLGMSRILGGIEVELAGPDGSWSAIGTFDEAGPIASDVQVIPLPEGRSDAPVRVRLNMARGSWRIDQVALASGVAPATSHVLQPVAVERGGVADHAALEALLDSTRALTTFRGDEYKLVFELPHAGAYELFLESRGYYYEWMRQEWMADEDAAALALMAIDPRAALRRLAPGFKQSEPRMEQLFWQSRFGAEKRGTP